MSRDDVKIKGFLRVQLRDLKNGKIQGDSGWLQNQITNWGFNSCLVALPLKCANSVQCSGLMLGSGTAPASDATDLPNSITDLWATFQTSTVIASLTARAICTLSHTDQHTIANIGIFPASNSAVVAGNTFTQSTLSTTQSVNCTYELRYS